MLQNGGATAAVADGLIKDTTTQTFMKDVIEESKRQPVLVDFWAKWCGPCKQLTPVLEKVVKNAKGKVKLVKMDIDKNPEIPGQLGIQSIPAIIAFVNGQPADGFMGALPEAQVNAFIERITKGQVAPEAQDLMKVAEQAIAQGATADAIEIYQHLVVEDPANLAAIGALAKLQVETGALDDAKATLAKVPEAKQGDAAIAAAKAALELAAQANAVGPIAELEQKVAADPKDHQSRFDLAVALNAKGQRKEALDHLMEIVKRDRKWNDDGARKQLVQLFDAWGPTDETTIDGRKRLSSILFS
jgi:putative thioredoxin